MTFLDGNVGLILQGFWLTLQLLVLAGICSFVLGTILAAFRVSPVPLLRGAAVVYVSIFRNTPLLVVFIFVFIAGPRLGINYPFLVKGVIAMSLYTSAFVAEALRSGINSVPVGQAEAARSIGLTFGQSMREVVMPQALRAVIPPMASVLIAMAKNTSVAAAFGLAEATATMRGLTNNNANERIMIFLVFALGYIVIVELMSFSANRLERRWRVA
ncbi:amino acid ABC transporter permease [Solicola sp. PLA-1-18]|uniref:amino acid ABC transporter permease n=1 Tax=Solicola sp. PLA-1-18 TaxID=3380532 RepID=UPI003B780102